jgi:hypothetical protein
MLNRSIRPRLAATIAFFSWLVWHRRKKRAELFYLITLMAPTAKATQHTSFRSRQRARSKNFRKAYEAIVCYECKTTRKTRPLWQLSLMFAGVTILLCVIARWA